MKKSVKKFMASALAATAITTYSLPAQTAETEPVNTSKWQEYNIVTDTAPIEEQLARYDNNASYKSAVEALISKESDAKVTAALSHGEFSKRYIVFWNAHLNPDLSMEIIEGFDGTGEKNGFSYTTNHPEHLNHNMKYVLECRDQVLSSPDKPNSLYLTYKKIRGCALDQMALADKEFHKLLEHVEVDPALFTAKLATYKKDETYQNAFHAHAKKLVNDDIIANMTYEAALILSHAVLNKDITWDDLKDTPDEDNENNPEFKWNTPTDSVADNNIQLLFQARDEILPEIMPTNIDKRLALYNQVIETWHEKTTKQKATLDASIAERAANVLIDIDVSVEEKIRQFNLGNKDEKSIYGPYAQAVKDQAQLFSDNKEFHRDYYINYIKVWHSVLDTSIENLDQLIEGMSFDDFSYREDKFWSPYLQENIAILFKHRDRILGDTKLSEITDPAETFNSIYTAAREEIDTAYQKYLDAVSRKNNDPAYGENAEYNHWHYAEKTHTDESYTADKLESYGLKAHTPDSPSLTDNFNILIKCRDEAKAAGTLNYETVHKCASQEVAQQYKTNESKVTRMWAMLAGGSVGTLLVGGIGFGAYRRKKNQPQLKAN